MHACQRGAYVEKREATCGARDRIGLDWIGSFHSKQVRGLESWRDNPRRITYLMELMYKSPALACLIKSVVGFYYVDGTSSPISGQTPGYYLGNLEVCCPRISEFG